MVMSQKQDWEEKETGSFLQQKKIPDCLSELIKSMYCCRENFLLIASSKAFPMALYKYK